MIDPAVFEPAMPELVREVIAEARVGRGIAARWFGSEQQAWGRVGECFALANRGEVPSVVVGWLVGMAMFEDDYHRLAVVFQRPSYRDDALPHVLDAFAAGVRANLPASGRQWAGIEAIARRVRELPPSVVEVLPIGLVSRHAMARAAALRLAQRIGAPARAVIEAARAGSRDPRLEEGLAALAATTAPVLDGGDDAALLHQLLDEWRATRDPALEPPIVLLGGKVGRARGELVAKSRGELEVAWLSIAAARDPLDVSRLLDAPWPSAPRSVLARVEALAEVAPDPRIAIKLAEVATTHRAEASTALHRAIAAVIARAPAAGALPALDTVEATRRGGWTGEIYAAARRAIAEPVQVANAALLEAARRVADPYDVAGLYADHLANPTDLAARAVLADALQLAGDPRGELIALQLGGGDDPKTQRRIEQLLALHGDAWSAMLPIDPAIRRFERGFLARVWCVASAELLPRFVGRPEWATIEDATFLEPDCDLAPLLARMPLLRTLGAHPSSLIQLRWHAPVRGIRTLWTGEGWIPLRGEFPDLVAVAGRWFAGSFREDSFARVQRAAVDAGIETIIHTHFMQAYLPRALQLARQGPAETMFALDRIADDLEGQGWRIAVRGGAVRVSCGRSIAAVGEGRELLDSIAASGFAPIALYLDPHVRPVADYLFARPDVVPGEPITLT